MDSIPSWMTEKEKEEYRNRDKAEEAAIQALIVAWQEGKFDEEARRLQAIEYAGDLSVYDWEVVEEEGPSWMTEKEKEEYRNRDKAEEAAIQASIVAWQEGKFDEEIRRLQAIEYAEDLSVYDWEVVEEEEEEEEEVVEMAEVDGSIMV
ncbi:hypothetical protein BDR22DRAFT_965649 [Usnea florida]